MTDQLRQEHEAAQGTYKKRGSIALARSLCYQINGAADEDDDMDGGGYGSVDVAEILSAEIERLREALAQPEQEPSQWRDMVVVSLVREGVNKHRARELADHFAAQRPWQGLTPEEVQFYALKHRQLVNAHYDAASDTNIITAAFEATVFYETVEQALKERNG